MSGRECPIKSLFIDYTFDKNAAGFTKADNTNIKKTCPEGNILEP